MTDGVSVPGQPGHGLNTVSGVSLVPGTTDRYVFYCGACDNENRPYEAGPYGLEEAKARLDLHQGRNTARAKDQAWLDQLGQDGAN